MRQRVAKAPISHELEPLTSKRNVDLGFVAGVHSIQGSRSHMEDTYQAKQCLNGDPGKAFFGVFDGHGGGKASEYTADHLVSFLLKQPFDTQPIASLRNSYQQTDHGWLTLAVRHGWDDGTTAITALICDGMLYVANVGDSRAMILDKHGKAVAMSEDHKPNRVDEKQRIERLGGRIIFYGTWRVEGILALTRAIGDKKLKRFVTSVPEIKSRRIREDDDLLILGSDGVWDVLTCQNAADVVSYAKDVKEAASSLTNYAYKQGSSDNITSMVIDLKSYYRAARAKDGQMGGQQQQQQQKEEEEEESENNRGAGDEGKDLEGEAEEDGEEVDHEHTH